MSDILRAKSQAELDVENALAQVEEEREFLESEVRRLKSFLNRGGVLLREEIRPGWPHWTSASRSRKRFDERAVQAVALLGYLRPYTARPSTYPLFYKADAEQLRKWTQLNRDADRDAG